MQMKENEVEKAIVKIVKQQTIILTNKRNKSLHKVRKIELYKEQYTTEHWNKNTTQTYHEPILPNINTKQKQTPVINTETVKTDPLTNNKSHSFQSRISLQLTSDLI